MQADPDIAGSACRSSHGAAPCGWWICAILAAVSPGAATAAHRKRTGPHSQHLPHVARAFECGGLSSSYQFAAQTPDQSCCDKPY
jgi:hypothetical protein